MLLITAISTPIVSMCAVEFHSNNDSSRSFDMLFIFELYVVMTSKSYSTFAIRTQTESTEIEMITGFLQGFVDNEINLNREQTCKNTCDDYKIARQYGCHNDTLCAIPLKNQRINKCKGVLRNCEFVGSDLEICPSVSEKCSRYAMASNLNHFALLDCRYATVQIFEV